MTLNKNSYKKENPGEDKNDYKVVLSDLGVSPLNMVKAAFVLMGVIPLLIILYLVIGKYFFYNFFLGQNGLIAAIAVLISFLGFLYAYSLVRAMIFKLLAYSAERKKSEDEKNEILLAVGHDLKSPLTVIKAGLYNIRDGIGAPVERIHVSTAEICLKTVEKITDFINELIEASKINFVRANFRRELVSFAKIVKSEIEEIHDIAKKNRQDLRWRVLANDTNLWGDRKKLSRLIMNLLSNAVKYTPPEGLIEAVVSADEGTVKLSVINSGSVILDEDVKRIFGRFIRLKEHEKIEGAGLGLSIVKDIVELHNGRISVSSKQGKDTEFSVILPRDLRVKS